MSSDKGSDLSMDGHGINDSYNVSPRAVSSKPEEDLKGKEEMPVQEGGIPDHAPVRDESWNLSLDAAINLMSLSFKRTVNSVHLPYPSNGKEMLEAQEEVKDLVPMSMRIQNGTVSMEGAYNSAGSLMSSKEAALRWGKVDKTIPLKKRYISVYESEEEGGFPSKKRIQSEAQLCNKENHYEIDDEEQYEGDYEKEQSEQEDEDSIIDEDSEEDECNEVIYITDDDCKEEQCNEEESKLKYMIGEEVVGTEISDPITLVAAPASWLTEPENNKNAPASGYEGEEDDDLNSKVKKRRARHSNEPSRCTHSNGKRRRCNHLVEVGYSLCKHHLGVLTNLQKLSGG